MKNRDKFVGSMVLLLVIGFLGALFGAPPSVATPANTANGPVVTRSEFAPEPYPYWFQGCINPMGPRMNYVSADVIFIGAKPLILKLFHQDSKGNWVPVTNSDHDLRIMVNGHESDANIQLMGTMGFWERRQSVSIMAWGVQPDERFRLLAQYNDEDNDPATNNPITSLKEWSAREVGPAGCNAPV